jgi:hypothetical protein
MRTGAVPDLTGGAGLLSLKPPSVGVPGGPAVRGSERI